MRFWAKRVVKTAGVLSDLSVIGIRSQSFISLLGSTYTAPPTPLLRLFLLRDDLSLLPSHWSAFLLFTTFDDPYG